MPLVSGTMNYEKTPCHSDPERSEGEESEPALVRILRRYAPQNDKETYFPSKPTIPLRACRKSSTSQVNSTLLKIGFDVSILEGVRQYLDFS